MNISPTGIALIKKFEGCKLEAYQDVAGVWTIGIGHIETAKPGQKITEQEAERLLLGDLARKEEVLNRELERFKITLNQNEYDALLSLAFNVGSSLVVKSTIFECLKKGNHALAANGFDVYVKAEVDGEKKIIPGLVRRRDAEKALFLSVPSDSHRPPGTSP